MNSTRIARLIFSATLGPGPTISVRISYTSACWPSPLAENRVAMSGRWAPLSARQTEARARVAIVASILLPIALPWHFKLSCPPDRAIPTAANLENRRLRKRAINQLPLNCDATQTGESDSGNYHIFYLPNQSCPTGTLQSSPSNTLQCACSTMLRSPVCVPSQQNPLGLVTQQLY